MSKKWQGQKAFLQASGGGLPTDPFGIIDSPEVSAPEQEVQELRGATDDDDVRWQDLMRTSVSVGVSGTIIAWDIGAYQDLIGWDDVAGEMDYSPDVPTFTITVSHESSDGSTKEITIDECYIDGSISLGGSREDWIGMDLQMVGRYISDITDTDASA